MVAKGAMMLLPGDHDWKTTGWDDIEQSSPGFTRLPMEFKTEGKPVECISRYTRSHADPFHFAMASGCTGVEVDLWLHENNILVGNSVTGLDADNTLSHVYLEPLLKAIEHQNKGHTPNDNGEKDAPRGVFADDPSKSFILLLNFKTTPNWLWPHLVSQLVALRERDYLTYHSGSEIVQRPVTVVLTGRAPFDLIRGDRAVRDIFFDASLEELALNDSGHLSKFTQPLASIKKREAEGSVPTADGSAETTERDVKDAHQSDSNERFPNPVYTYNVENTYSASANFRASIGMPKRGKFSRQQIEMIRAHVRAARNRGLKVRYTGIPEWHSKLRNLVWHTLVNEGVDIIEIHSSGEYHRPGRGRRALQANEGGRRARQFGSWAI